MGTVTLYMCVLTTLLTPHRMVRSEGVLEKVEDCFTNEEDRLIDFRNITVGVLESGKWGLIGLVEANLETMTMASIEFTKCASKQEPETCTYFTTVRQNECCKMLEAKNEFWTPFFSNTVPPMRCPMKGLYNFENSEMDLAVASKVLPGFEGFYWKVKSTIFFEKKKVGCYILELSTIKT